VTPQDLADRFDGLDRFVGAVHGHLAGHVDLDTGAVAAAGRLAHRGLARLRLSGDHTVVALAGSTGGGKSSLFNALVRMELSPVGDLRPTTGETNSCTWSTTRPDPLLDWLGVDRGRRFVRESVLDADREAPLRGLVLLDLPDMDSVLVDHRFEVDRLVGVADLVIWVLDPQKYADQTVHEDYLGHLGGLRDATVVVLNQVDRLSPDDAARCRADLARLVEADGLAGVPVLATSAVTGEGIPAVRVLLEKAVAGRHAAFARLEAELGAALTAVVPLVGPDAGADAVSREVVVELADRLATAAGANALVAGAEREYARRARLWPGRSGRDVDAGASEVVPADPIAVSVALRRVAARAAVGLPSPWPDELRRAVSVGAEGLPEALARSLAAARRRPPRALGWLLARIAGWLAAFAATAGVGWSGWYVAARIDGSSPDLPDLGGIAVPLVLAVGGLLTAVGLTVIGRPLAAAGARRHAARVKQRLHGVTEAAARDALAPMRAVLNDYADACEAYDLVAGRGPYDR
jgi:hypothetical protein